MDRLVFNTPGRMGSGGKDPDRLVLFVILFMAFLAIFVLAFILWYVFDPLRAEKVVRDVKSQVATERRMDSKDYQLFFGDDPTTTTLPSPPNPMLPKQK